MNKTDISIADAPIKDHSLEIQETVLAPTPMYSFSWSGYFQAIGIIMFILLFFGGILVLLKKKGITLFTKKYISSSEKQLYVKQQLALDAKKSLVVVQFLNKQLLLGVTETTISLLVQESLEGNNTHEQNVKDFNVLMEDAKNTSEESS
ncbi:MAG: FliO/MopB family protein [Desulfovibrionaceae bacterium]